jgi:hypothetical protein
MDDAIAKACKIGEANAKIVTLAQNWCAHLQIQRWGGTGMVEEMTGLPIGMRFFKCDYASAAGMAGMDLRHIALDFYDRNCKGCDKRHPVKMPNLGDLVAEREGFAKDQERANSKMRESKTAAYEARREARNEARLNCDEPTAGLIDAIERLDSEGSSEAASVLAEIAKVAPQRFDTRVQSLLFTLAEESDSPIVNEGILETLRLVSTDSQRLCSLALRLLAKHSSSVAADVVSHFVGPTHVSLIPDALGALLYLAGPDENHFHFLGTEREPEPAGLLAVYKVAPDLVMDAIKASLSDSRKMSRILKHVKNGPLGDHEHALKEYDLYDFVIYRCVVGSQAYGLSHEGSDTDRRGIYLPPADLHWSLYGVPEQLENAATEEVYWELQKFLVLALKANPNVLECLYSPLIETKTELAEDLLSHRDAFLSKLVYQTYNGYVLSQFKRLEQDLRSIGTIKWKHAMHLIRLLLSGITVLCEGFVPLSVEADRDRLLSIRRGEMDWESVNAWRLNLHQEFEDAFAETALPESPDYQAVNEFLLRARRSMAR